LLRSTAVYFTICSYQVMNQSRHHLKSISQQFWIHGDFIEAVPYGSGHINDTFATTYQQAGSRVRYIHQRINHNIFKDPVRLMANVYKATNHIRNKLDKTDSKDVSREVLTVIPSQEGFPYYRDEEGNYWRTYLFIEGAKTYDVIETPQQAFEAARAFGKFQKMLADLPDGTFHETIPNFHHTRKRYDTFAEALSHDKVNRAREVKREIEFCQRNESIVDVLLDLQSKGILSPRATHNDTKLNNVMLDNETGRGICVIDLDTLMPGLVHYDFGDMIRTSTSPAAEDEKDLSKVKAQKHMIEALARGYLETAGEFLTPKEKSLLVFSGKLIAFETGLRFLTDFLSGDTYFKIKREGHNLDRCRTQFKLVESIISQEDELNTMVERIIS